MKILWFSLSPCGSIRRSNVKHVIQGWMISLEDVLKQRHDIQLEVAFISNSREDSFDFDGVKYYPICGNVLNANNGINRIRERFLSQKIRDNKVLTLMLNVVRQSQPDIIHIHGTEGVFGLIAEHIADIPIVFPCRA